jgi:hypothetical protein
VVEHAGLGRRMCQVHDKVCRPGPVEQSDTWPSVQACFPQGDEVLSASVTAVVRCRGRHTPFISRLDGSLPSSGLSCHLEMNSFIRVVTWLSSALRRT